MDKKVILSASKLCKSFAHNGSQLHILNSIDLDIYEGDFTVIMGESGSGKSTLLYALSGMDRATSGQVMYLGNDIVTMPEKKLTALRVSEFGFVFQQIHLVSNLSLRENITVTGYLNPASTASEVNRYADELLEKMGLTHIKTHLPAQCSGGEMQRCAIARAIVNSPKLLFADEPTGALNKRNSTEILDLLTRLNRDGQSILMVTHDSRAALRASRILYISDGRVINELSLPKYEPDQEKHREAQISAWLSSLEW